MEPCPRPARSGRRGAQAAQGAEDASLQTIAALSQRKRRPQLDHDALASPLRDEGRTVHRTACSGIARTSCDRPSPPGPMDRFETCSHSSPDEVRVCRAPTAGTRAGVAWTGA